MSTRFDRLRLRLDRALAQFGEAWRAVQGLDRRDAGRIAVAAILALIVLASAAWRVGTRLLAPAGRASVQAEEVRAAPVVTSLAPKQRLRAREHAQPVALVGRHFASNMSVRITTPDARIATYGPEALSNVTATHLTVRAIFDIPGTYHLVLRTPSGAQSNDLALAVAR